MKKQKNPAFCICFRNNADSYMNYRNLLMIVLFWPHSISGGRRLEIPFRRIHINRYWVVNGAYCQSGDPNSVQYNDNTASFKQMISGFKDFERNSQGQELSSREAKKKQGADGCGNV